MSWDDLLEHADNERKRMKEEGEECPCGFTTHDMAKWIEHKGECEEYAAAAYFIAGNS